MRKVRQRGPRSVRDIAEELNMSAGTLRKWWARSNRSAVQAAPRTELPSALAAESWSAAQRLLALQETHGLSGEALNDHLKDKSGRPHRG